MPDKAENNLPCTTLPGARIHGLLRVLVKSCWILGEKIMMLTLGLLVCFALLMWFRFLP